MPEPTTPGSSPPESRTVHPGRFHLSAVWLIPIVAVLAGAWVAVTRILAAGPTITITIDTAEGLAVEKTKIHYNGVDVGVITDIRLSDHHSKAVLTAQMEPKTERLLVADTKFWVVSPRISGANVTGLNTLISGAYIGMQIGESAERRRSFVALAAPPIVASDTPGRFFVLRSPDAGSMDAGTPVYFRRLAAGEVVSRDLSKDGQSFEVRIFIRAPYDQYVTTDTRFWKASGVDLTVGAGGIELQTESLLSIIVGGIAYETPANGPPLPAAEPESVFTLAKTRAEAVRPPPNNPGRYRLIFRQSIRGLKVGSPVEFRGVPIGEVIDIGAEINTRTLEFTAPVTIELDAARMGVKMIGPQFAGTPQQLRHELIERLVAKGARAQLRKANLLTGGVYIDFERFPDAPPARLDWSQTPVELPTIAGELELTEQRLIAVLHKLEEVPMKEIGEDLRRTAADLDKVLVSADSALQKADRLLGNADRMVEPESVLGTQLGMALEEITRAAQSLRSLADYLERHPEALIRGKPGGPDEEKK